MKKLGKFGFHGATDEIEGSVWRVEMLFDPRNHKRQREVEFLCKYVRPEKVDGIFLDGVPIYNFTQ